MDVPVTVSNERFRMPVAALCAVAIALGIALSAFTYLRGESVNNNTETLVGRDLPTFDGIAELKAALVRTEPILYEYYATEDQQAFYRRYLPNREKILAGFDLLERAFPAHPLVSGIRLEYTDIEARARQLDSTLCCRPVDWDLAREILAQTAVNAAGINEKLDALIVELRESVFRRAAVTRAEVGRIVGMVLAFSAAILVLLALSGYSLRAYLNEARARRQLALFPERNPAPILSVARDGRVLYANPGAWRMLETGHPAQGDPSALLPADLAERLSSATAGGVVPRCEYPALGRVLECEIHPMPDIGVFHVYLSDITERQNAQRKLLHQAFHDSLTGLPNRFRLEEQVAEAAHGAAAGADIALILITVDRLRLVIDSFGYQTGDLVLKAAAGHLSELVGEAGAGASLFRMGGAQFAVLMRPEPGRQPESFVQAVLELAHKPLNIGEREIFVTYSLGSCVLPMAGTDAGGLVKQAGAAVEAVKRAGGNSHRRYTGDLDERAREVLEVGGGLRRALERNELVLHYQPQIRIPGGGLTGFEALVRWQHPDRGMIPPGKFIPVAEQTGLIVQIGEQVLRTACAQACDWVERGLRDFVMAVNISPRQFSAGDLPRLVEKILVDSGLPGKYLELEVTEGAAMVDVERSIEVLRALKALGVKLAIDDFGTGYSSLAYLQRFPLDKLKVDQSFVRGMTENLHDAAIVRAVLMLGRSLNLSVLAEGVETEAQREQLLRYGCDEIQGYLIGRPLPAAEAEMRWLPPHAAAAGGRR
jgi:diguanylate cyclase (GGDEF)-like protein